jgi:hypothetical protein
MTDYLENPRCGDSNSSFSLEFSSDMNQMEGGKVGDKLGGFFGRSPSPTNLDFIAISDPEGYDIFEQAKGAKFNLSDKTSKQQLYICGDLIDSTASFGDHIGIKDNIVTDINRVRAKSCNLHNIALCMVHERIHLIFGNRDLNKLKCKFLCKLAGKGEFIDKFNNGNIDLKIDSKDTNHPFESDYTKLKNQISEKKLNDKPWEIHRMKQWYPFWNLEKLTDDTKLKFWKKDDNYSDNFFLDRFNEIFGADPTVGTIGAQNLLYTIPYEINNNNLPIGIELTTGDDFRAFIVLAVFRSMCLKAPKVKFNNIFSIVFEKPSLIKKTNTSHYKGWLYNLYNKGSVVKVIDDKKK